jgi:hypothetical protein
MRSRSHSYGVVVCLSALSLGSWGCEVGEAPGSSELKTKRAPEASADNGAILERDDAAVPAPSAAHAQLDDELAVDIRAVDPGLRAAYIREVQRSGGEQFHMQRRAQLITADNRDQSLEMRFDRAGVAVTTRKRADAPEVQTVVTLAGVGRAGRALAPLAIEELRHEGARVEYDRGNVLEWYVNGPLGLEQGFTFAERPEGDGRVEIALDLQGDLDPVLSEDGQRVELRAGDEVVLAVSELHVRDRDGFTLPSSLEVRQDQIILAFDDAEAAYPVEVDPLFGQLLERKTASDAQSYALYGTRVVSDGTRVAIGAPNHDRTAAGTSDGFGAVYVYERTAGVWQQTAKLTPGTAADLRGSRFGESLAIAGNVLIVGAPSYNGGRGTVFVFRRGVSWAQEARLTLASPVANDRFGASLSLAGTRLLVGASNRAVQGVSPHGNVFVYRNTSGTTWSQVAEINGPPTVLGWGSAVAQAGRFVAIGAPLTSFGSATENGLVYVYRETAAGADSWQTTTPAVLDCRPVNTGKCGASLDMGVDSSGTELVLVGEPGGYRKLSSSTPPVGDLSGNGWIYTYSGSGTAWTELRLNLAVDKADNVRARYGAVALSSRQVNGEWRIAAAVGPTAGAEGNRAVQVFERTGTTWGNPSFMTQDTSAQDGFGASVALAFDHLVVGAGTNDMAGESAGRAFFYNVGLNKGLACTSGGQCASGLCVDGVCCTTTCGGGSVSDCQACSIARGGTQNGVCTALTNPTASSITCRNASGVCDVADRCVAGNMACPEAFAPTTTQCRPAVTGGCDVADFCTGTSSACPADRFAPSSTVCRVAAAGGCDVAERCTGSSAACPANGFSGAGTVCRPVAGVCDVAEVCSGASASCPTNAFIPQSEAVICRLSVDFEWCDLSETCSGSSASCPPQQPITNPFCL